MGRGSLSDRGSISLWLTPILKHGAGNVAADVHNDGNGSLLGVRGLSLLSSTGSTLLDLLYTLRRGLAILRSQAAVFYALLDNPYSLRFPRRLLLA